MATSYVITVFDSTGIFKETRPVDHDDLAEEVESYLAQYRGRVEVKADTEENSHDDVDDVLAAMENALRDIFTPNALDSMDSSEIRRQYKEWIAWEGDKLTRTYDRLTE